MTAGFEIVGCWPYEAVVLEKTVVLALIVAGPGADRARGVVTVVAIAIVFDWQVLIHSVAKVADWY